jgi:hypothetical protein
MRARRSGAVSQKVSHAHDLDCAAGWSPLELSLTEKEQVAVPGCWAYRSRSSAQGSYAKESTKMRLLVSLKVHAA